MKGKLYIVSTPIGNLKDITIRALDVLKEVDIVAAEDTRRAQKLLNHYEIKVKTISYHSHNEHRVTDNVLDLIETGKNIAIVTDAGTPCISDPGFFLVREAIEREIEPIIIPGVSAVTFAACASGLPVDTFTFYGFLHVKQGRRHRAIAKIKEEDKTVFVYESPHRMEKLLKEISELISPETKVAVIREATKVYEEVLRGTAKELVEQTAQRKWKGECVVAISTKHLNETNKKKNKYSKLVE